MRIAIVILVLLALMIPAMIYTRMTIAEDTQRTLQRLYRDGELSGQAGASPDSCPAWRLDERAEWMQGYIDGKRLKLYPKE